MKMLIAILALALMLGAGIAQAADLAGGPGPAAEIVPAARLSPPPEENGRGSWQGGFGLDYGRRFGPGYYSGPSYGLGYPSRRAYPFLTDPSSPYGSSFGFGLGRRYDPYPYGFGYGDRYGRSPYSSGWYSPFGGSYLGRGGQAPRFGEDAPQGGPIGQPNAR